MSLIKKIKNSMSKKESKVELTSANITEELMKSSMLTEDLVTKAAEEIEKEKDEAKIRKAKEVIRHTEWLERDSLLNLKKARDKEDVEKDIMKQIGKLKTDIMSGAIPPDKFDDEAAKIYKAENDKLEEIDKKFKGLKDFNNKQYDSAWRYETFRQSGGRKPWFMS